MSNNNYYDRQGHTSFSLNIASVYTSIELLLEAYIYDAFVF
jgi:hypothetical protein